MIGSLTPSESTRSRIVSMACSDGLVFEGLLDIGFIVTRQAVVTRPLTSYSLEYLLSRAIEPR